MARRAIIRITPELLAHVLKLPTAYKPVSVFHEFQRDCVALVVEHPYLRDVPAGLVLPEITPVYREETTRRVVLDRVEGGPL